MKRKRFTCLILTLGILVVFSPLPAAYGLSDAFRENIYKVGALKPIDSVPKLKIGKQAPGFTLPAVSGEKVSLNHYIGKKNVVLSFVPAAWTPVCSDQWPGYNLVKDLFEMNEA
ncbi:MAG: redoxin domain-containing protein, partial [Pseudomonadota bacterium]